MDQMKADISLKQAQTLKSQQDRRLDPQRVLIQVTTATAGIVGAIAALLGYLVGNGSH